MHLIMHMYSHESHGSVRFQNANWFPRFGSHGSVSIFGSVSTVRFGHDANRANRISGTDSEPDGAGLGWTELGGGCSIHVRYMIDTCSIHGQLFKCPTGTHRPPFKGFTGAHKLLLKGSQCSTGEPQGFHDITDGVRNTVLAKG